MPIAPDQASGSARSRRQLGAVTVSAVPDDQEPRRSGGVPACGRANLGAPGTGTALAGTV